MKGLKLGALKSYEPTPAEFEELKRSSIEEVAHLCGGEQVISAAGFRQGGAAGQDVAGDLGNRLGGLGLGFLAKKGTAMARKQRAGGLPKSMLLAVTPNRLYAFDTSYRISTRRSERENGKPTEAAAWDRDAVGFEVGKSGAMSTLRIEPRNDGAVATVVGGSTADDPWSLEVMALLDPRSAS
jgi:hypothetical protein